MTNQARSHIYSVSKLNKFAKHVLESEIGQIWISAEISNFVAATSGHWYFTLKDERAQLKSAMFKGSNRFSRFMPKNGDKVLVRGNISLYEPRGDYQLIASHMEPEGEGLLKQQFEQIKQRLAMEGLFAKEHKHPLPESPKAIGVITSDTGAAWHDIVTVLQRRNPTVDIVLYPSQVQGETAAEQICQAIMCANHRKEVDVLIVGRGGGSMEDLWSFNNEALARIIFDSDIPIISAVGHEIDFTIADFVADMRAPTPSAAAEIASPPLGNVVENLTSLRKRLQVSWQQQMQRRQHLQQLTQHKLESCHPKSQLQQQQQTVDNLLLELNTLWQENLMNKRLQWEQQQSRLSQVHPKHQLDKMHQQSKFLLMQLKQTFNGRLTTEQQKLGTLCQVLDTVSPLATLSRGYTLTFKNEQLVKDPADLNIGDTIKTRFKNGEVVSTVNSTPS